MMEPRGERLLWRTISRLDEAEGLLLKPGPAGLGALVNNLEEIWRELSVVELAVRQGGDTSAWRAELEQVRARVSGLAMLLDHAQEMLSGWQMASVGAYCGDGRTTAPGQRVAGGRLDEEG